MALLGPPRSLTKAGPQSSRRWNHGFPFCGSTLCLRSQHSSKEVCLLTLFARMIHPILILMVPRDSGSWCVHHIVISDQRGKSGLDIQAQTWQFWWFLMCLVCSRLGSFCFTCRWRPGYAQGRRLLADGLHPYRGMRRVLLWLPPWSYQRAFANHHGRPWSGWRCCKVWRSRLEVRPLSAS